MRFDAIVVGGSFAGLAADANASGPLVQPLADEIAMQGYAGSVAFDGAGARVAITSPRGGRLHVFDQNGFAESVLRPDICGVAPASEGFLATDGLGGVMAAGVDGLVTLSRHDNAWDNHLVVIG